jgi:hypothetical protein
MIPNKNTYIILPVGKSHISEDCFWKTEKNHIESLFTKDFQVKYATNLAYT